MKFKYIVIEIFLFVLLFIFYGKYICLFQGFSNFFSTSLAHRLQTDAFLQGRLSLSDHPFGLPWDYIWTGQAMHQNWGLGVPLLRLPFEWAAHVLGFGAFPDRLTLVFYLILMVLILNIAIKSLLKQFSVRVYSGIGLLIRWFLLVWVLFLSGMSELFKIDFRVYEETIFYAGIYSNILMALLFIYLGRPRKALLFVICLVCGMAWLVRPTLIIYGLTTVTLTLFLAYQEKKDRRLVAAGVLLFCIGITANLFLNYCRFGSFIEFGYAGAVNGSTAAEYPLRFGNPYNAASLVAAARELTSAMFFNYRWSANIFRWREFGAAIFNVFHLIVLLAGLVFLFALIVTRCREFFSACRKSGPHQSFFFLMCWGFINFFVLYIFYLHYFLISPRYLVDFSSSINAVVSGLILLGTILLIKLNLKRGLSIAVCFVLLTMIAVYNANIYYQNKYASSVLTTQQGVMEQVAAFERELARSSNLPDRFYCGRTYPNDGLYFQFAGWNNPGECSVASSIDIFLPSQRCLLLNFTIASDVPQPEIRVRRDFGFMKLDDYRLVGEPETRSRIITETFCSDVPSKSNISLYSIAWINVNHFTLDRLPVTLNWVGSAEHPDRDAVSLLLGKPNMRP
ncbi:MAG: hypothetical protein HQL22_11925 [Candidatus Omnitrophica bacterium]|nr:hypothetical protein [Candidatus Omnitrophota bacterium]